MCCRGRGRSMLSQATILAEIFAPCPLGSIACFPHTWALSPSRFFCLLLSYLMVLPLCLEQRLWGYKSNLSHVGRERRVLAGVMLEIPSEVCVSPTPIRSEPWREIPALSWDLDMAHAAQEEFVETSLDLEGTSLPVPGADPEAVPSLPCDHLQSQPPQDRLPQRAALLLPGDPVGNLAEEAAGASVITSAFSLCPDTGWRISPLRRFVALCVAVFPVFAVCFNRGFALTSWGLKPSRKLFTVLLTKSS